MSKYIVYTQKNTLVRLRCPSFSPALKATLNFWTLSMKKVSKVKQHNSYKLIHLQHPFHAHILICTIGIFLLVQFKKWTFEKLFMRLSIFSMHTNLAVCFCKYFCTVVDRCKRTAKRCKYMNDTNSTTTATENFLLGILLMSFQKVWFSMTW